MIIQAKLATKVVIPTTLSCTIHSYSTGTILAPSRKMVVSGRVPATMRDARVPGVFAFFQYSPAAVVSKTLAEYMVPVIAMKRKKVSGGEYRYPQPRTKAIPVFLALAKARQ